MTSTSDKPLRPDDFPLDAEGQQIKKQDGTPNCRCGMSCGCRWNRRTPQPWRSHTRRRQVVGM